MNCLIRISFWAILLFVFPSCNKRLNTTPSILTTSNFYQSLDQLNAALAGVYDPLGNANFYGDTYLRELTVSNDLEMYRADAAIKSTISYYTGFDYTNADINSFWTVLYTGIGNANVLLDALPKANVDPAKKQLIRGQALFLRAYYYFILVDNFGGVPLRLHATKSATDITYGKSAPKDIYAQILSDMDTAYNLVQTANVLGPNSCGQISKNTVAGILARVCLTMAGQPLNDVSKYQDALTWSKTVINMQQNSLNPNYAQIFINEAQDIYDIKECLWEVEFYGNNTNAYRETGYVGIRNGNPSTNAIYPGYGYTFLGATPKLYYLYDATRDLRRDRTIANYFWNAEGQMGHWSSIQIYDRFPGKWRREEEVLLPRYKNGNGTNFPILRYADVLLMYAEAEAHVNGPDASAYSAVNQVRERGWGKLLTGATNPTEADLPAGLSATAFLDSLQDERGRELSFECLRSHDLKRWGLLITNLQTYATYVSQTASTAFIYETQPGVNISSRNLLFPIPSSEISLNKAMTQNPGW